MKNEIEIVKAHADLGASNCERWWNCPGSVDLIARNGCVSKGSSYADEGTLAHAYADYQLKEYFCKLEDSDKHPTEEMPADMQDAINVYFKYVLDLEYDYKVNARHIHFEKRVHIDIPGTELFGTVDCAIHVPYRKLIVIDYKHGAGHKVEVFENKQLLFYALGAIDSLLTKEQVEELETVEMVIVQPRCFGGGISSWEITIGELETHRLELISAVKAVVPTAKLSAGDWCKWCPAKAVCPAIVQASNEAAGVVFQEIAPKNLLDPNVLTFEQKVKILDHKDLIEEWLDAIFNDVRDAAERGEEIPGWKLVTGQTKRKWIDETHAEQVIITELSADGYSITGIFAKPKLVGIPAMEKEWKSLKLDMEVLNNLIEKPEGKKTLAKIGDPRKSQEARAISAFKNVKTKEQK